MGTVEPGDEISPGETPDDATAAIKEGNEYPAPIEVATDGCPNREAAAAMAVGCVIELPLSLR